MPPEVVQFGDVTVDFRRMSITRGSHPVSIEPKTFDVLRYLIEHRDRLVTKEELLDAAWKDTFVTPNVLTRAIAQLRKAIGDDAFEARYVETVAKRGYRFIAPVTAVAAARVADPDVAAVPAPQASSTSGRRRMAAAMSAVVLVAVIGFVIYAMRDRDAGATADAMPSQLSPRRFTTGSYSYSFPSISPDGRTIAYSSERDGLMEIYTSGLTAGSKESALTSDGGQNIFAEWSPDGQWIAYHSRKKGGIWIIPSSGGAARQIIDFGSHPAWTPDGRQIVFTSDAGGMAAQSVLWIVRTDGSDRRQLTKLGAPRGGHSKPSVSPDGRWVAFGVSNGHISTEVWIAPIDGSLGIKLGNGASPHFSGDGKTVYWVGRTIEGNDALMRVSISEDGSPSSDPGSLQTFTGNFIGDFSVARDGSAVMWLFRAQANLWAVDVLPSGRTAKPVAITADDVRNTQPRHARDGRITFNQYTVGQPPSVWIMNEDGSNRESLTVGLNVAVLAPQWSPDGTRVFAQLADFNRKLSFGWLDIATRQLTPVAISGHGVLSPVLSPDGRELVFHVIDEAGVINVWRQAIDGGPRKQVTFDGEAMSYPTWSPDGQSVVVEIKRGDHTHIGIVSKDGGPVEMLVTERGQSWPFSWAPDGDRIAFAGSRDGVWNIYSVSRKTKDVRQVTDFASVEGYVRYPSWSRTRDSIVFERAEQRGSLWTVRLP